MMEDDEIFMTHKFNQFCLRVAQEIREEKERKKNEKTKR